MRAVSSAVFFGFAVYKELGSYAGVAVDPLAVIGRKVAAEVRKTLFERIDVANFGFFASQDGNDVVENLGIKVSRKRGSKLRSSSSESNSWMMGGSYLRICMSSSLI